MGAQRIFQLLIGVFHVSGNVNGIDVIELQDVVDGLFRHHALAYHRASGITPHDCRGHAQDGILEHFLVNAFPLTNLLFENAHSLTSP